VFSAKNRLWCLIETSISKSRTRTSRIIEQAKQSTMTFPFSADDSMSTIDSIDSNNCDVEEPTTIADRRKRRRPSILILGASSRTGLECIQQLSEHPSKPYIHAFNEEDMPDMDDEYFHMCHTVIEGSMRHAIDIEDALKITGANWVVLCNDRDVQQRRPKDHSTVCAKNVVHVLEQPHFEFVRALVVSRIEAAPPNEISKRLLLSVRCKLRQRKSRPILQDLAEQEKRLHAIWDRVTVVRTTQLSDTSPNHSSRKLLHFSDDELVQSVRASPNCSFTSASIERVDLASYIVDEICTRPIPTGSRVINVMSAKI
jgi:hypothetical protein